MRSPVILACFAAGSGGIAAAQQDHTAHDSAFHAMQQRGAMVMGVDQATSVHYFVDLPDGGRIDFQNASDDSAAIATIRGHLRQVAREFKSGDFHNPMLVHAQEVPGTATMAARRQKITYTYRDLPRGGEVRIATRDSESREAVHRFLAFQRQDHRTE